MDIHDVEIAYQDAGEQCGGAERAFSTAQDNPTNPQNQYAVLIENITKTDIVQNSGAFADLVLPKREALATHKLFSFLALNENNTEHQAVLTSMLELAVNKNGSTNNTLFFNVRRKKNSPADTDSWFTIMSVAYLHLWSVQTNAMRRSDADFMADGLLPNELTVGPEVLKSITDTISKTFAGVSAETLTTHAYAPLDIRLSCESTTPFIHLFLAARIVLRLFETDENLSPALERGVRLMARLQKDTWQLHVITGTRLQAITKKDA